MPSFAGDKDIYWLDLPGVIILPTQTMQYYRGNPANLPDICIKFDFPKMGNLIIPVYPHPSNDGIFALSLVRDSRS